MRTLAVAPLLGLLAAQEGYVETRRMLPLLGDELVHDAAAGDVDGDGDVDVLLGRDGQEALLVNRGEGLFDDGSPHFPSTNAPTSAVALADLDGDGDLDAYVGNGYADGVYHKDAVLANDGSGSFTVAFNDVGEENVTVDVEVSDADLDGDADVVVALTHGTQTLSLRRNSGAGLMLLDDPAAFPAVPISDQDVALGDLDGDLDADALVGGFSGAWTLANDGTGHFTVSGTPSAFGSPDLGDVDGDGDLDAYFALAGPDRLLLNDGAGSFVESPAPLPPASTGSSPQALFVDADLDGDLDVIGVDPVFVFFNDGSGALSDATSTSTSYAFASTRLAVLDADGDLDQDLILFPPSGRPPHLWLNAHGVFFAAHAHPNANQEIHGGGGACAIGDVDGNGTADLVSSVGIASVGGAGLQSQAQLLINDGKAVFTDVTATHMPPASPDDIYCAELADADLDGDLDLALGVNGPDLWYRNAGGGSFTSLPGALPVEHEGTLGLATGDLDGDGDLDQVSTYAVYFAPPPPVRLFLGDASGIFVQAPTALVAANPNQQMRDPELVDVDLDGDLDVFLAGIIASELHFNNGTALFQHMPAALSNPPAATGIAAGDVNGDGDTDVVFGSATAASKVYANDGAGAFSLSATLYITSKGGPVELVDEDHDGDLDLFSGLPLELFRNGGTGTFTADHSALSQQGEFVGLADLDGDQDTDLLFNEFGRLTLTTRVAGGQVVWRSFPRASKDQHLEVFGPSGTPYGLAAALGTASIPLPPFGTLLLDPATLVLAGGGWIPSAGVASLKAPVPGDATLIGATIWWQALAGSPLRLTNADRTMLSVF